MSYGTSAIRLDIGKEARIRTAQFFNIPGSLSQTEIVKPAFFCLHLPALTLLPDLCCELASQRSSIPQW